MRGNGIVTSFLKSPVIARFLVIIIFLMMIFGVMIHALEPANFPTILDGAWWVIVTTATIGYGDFVPKTGIGKLLGILLIFIGTGFVSTYFATLAAAAMTRENSYTHGELTYRGVGHLIIIGWNERVRTIISQLSQEEKFILIDESLNEIPPKFNHIHFIHGNPTKDDTLLKANIKEAKIVLITADQSKDELLADTNTILTLLAIKGLNPDVYAIAEILTTHQKNNAQRAGADEIIETNMLTSYVMSKSIHSKGISETLSLMLDHQEVTTLEYIEPETKFIGKTFSECNELLFQNNYILIGIKKGNKPFINPPRETIMEEDDKFIVITK